MSERTNKERAREELRDRKILAEIEYNQSEDAKKKDNLLRYIKALDIAIESLDNEWVDVRDRLPKDNERVLVYLKEDQMVHIGKYETPTKEDIEWIKSDMYDDGITDEDVKREFKRLELMGLGWEILEVDEVNFECEVIAWKPLPKPYERKE